MIARILWLFVLGCDDKPSDDVPSQDSCSPLPWYADADGDGYGDPEAVLDESCSAPSGASADASDCDDAVAGTYPGAPELCDGEDNDCNGFADDGLPSLEVWLDRDGDGYGDDASATTWCEVSDGLVDQAGDCDDGDPAVSPGEPERLGDEVDNDCDDRVDQITVEEPFVDCASIGVFPGCDFAQLTDWSGDGFPEVAVGSPGEDAVHILSGQDLSSHARFEGDYTYGVSVLALGDGLLVSAPVASTTSSEVTWRGPDGGERGNWSAPTADVELFGHRIWPGVNTAFVGFRIRYDTGLIFGAAIDPLSFEGEVQADAEGALGVFPLTDPAEVYSDMVLADFDGSGSADLIVGDPGAEEGDGVVYVAADVEAPGIATVLEEMVITGETGSAFGAALDVLDDIDGDGRPELLACAPNAEDGTAYIFTWAELQLSQATDALGLIRGTRAGSCASVRAIDDFNGDDSPDIALAAPGEGWVELYGLTEDSLSRWRAFGSVEGHPESELGTFMLPITTADGPTLLLGAPGGARAFAVLGVAE